MLTNTRSTATSVGRSSAITCAMSRAMMPSRTGRLSPLALIAAARHVHELASLLDEDSEAGDAQSLGRCREFCASVPGQDSSSTADV
jgi:hypothetical protein